jgi:hypothetical protein
MRKYVSLFDDYEKLEESYNFDSESLFESKINQMLSLKQNGCMPGVSMNEFKEFFGSQRLVESRGYEESEMLLEKAYNSYELSMLAETKSHWFDDDQPQMFEYGRGMVPYLEFEGNILLFKDMEGFLISEGALEMLKTRDQSINEDVLYEIMGEKLYEWSLFDNPLVNGIVGAVKGAAEWTNNNIIKPAVSIVKYVGGKLGDFIDWIGGGLVAAYNFVSKIMSAISEFLSDWSDIIFIVTLVLQVVGGVISFIPGVGTTLGPILLIIAGAIQIVVGSGDVKDGIKACSNCPIDPSEKAAPLFVEGGVKILGGGISVLLGVHDIITSPKAAVPGGAFSSTAAATTGKAWVKKTGVKLSGAGTVVALFEGVLKWIIEHAGEAATKAIAKKATRYGAKKGAVLAGKAFTKASAEVLGRTVGSYGNQCVVPMLCMGGKYALGWLWDSILGAVSGIGSIINKILDLPQNVIDGVDTFNKKHSSGLVGLIIGGALNLFVKPAAKVVRWFVDNTIKPIVKPVTNWMVSLGKQSNAAIKMIESDPKIKAAVTGKQVPQPKKGPAPVKKIEVTAKEKKYVAKIQASKALKDVNKKIAKEGGFYNEKFKKIQEKNLAKVKAAQEKIFKEKFPGVMSNKSEGEFINLKDGTMCFRYKSKSAHGTVTLFSNGRYFVKDGPNQGTKGDYTAKKNIDLKPPKEGFKKGEKKNESRAYVRTFESFSFS